MISKLKSLLPQNGFVRSVSVLVGGTASSQALMVLAAPLLTRLYTPEDFGLLAVYAGLLALFNIIASLRYELAIPLPESNVEAANLLVLSILLVVVTTFLSGLMVLFIGEQIALILETPSLSKYFWLLPVGVLLTGVYKAFNYWSVRTKAFGNIAKTRIMQTVSTIIIQVLGSKFGAISLLFGQAAGQGVGSVKLAKSAINHTEFHKWSWEGIWHVAVRYKQFPIFSTWSALFNTAGSQLPPLLFAALFNASAAGFYTLASRVLTMPMSIMGDAIGKVFFSSAAQAYREGLLAPLVKNVYQKLVHIVTPVAVVLVVLGPDLFALVFGEDWREAGDFARYMSVWIFMVFITSPLTTLFVVFEREKLAMTCQLILLSVRLLAILIGATILNDLLFTVVLFSYLSALFYLGVLIWIFKTTGNQVIDIFCPLINSLVKVSICVVPLVIQLNLTTEFKFGNYIATMVTIFMLAIYYFRTLRNNGL